MTITKVTKDEMDAYREMLGEEHDWLDLERKREKFKTEDAKFHKELETTVDRYRELDSSKEFGIRFFWKTALAFLINIILMHLIGAVEHTTEYGNTVLVAEILTLLAIKMYISSILHVFLTSNKEKGAYDRKENVATQVTYIVCSFLYAYLAKNVGGWGFIPILVVSFINYNLVFSVYFKVFNKVKKYLEEKVKSMVKEHAELHEELGMKLNILELNALTRKILWDMV